MNPIYAQPSNRPTLSWNFPPVMVSIILLLSLLLSACASATPAPEMSVAEMPPAAPMEAFAEGARGLADYNTSTQSSGQSAERIVIKNANLSIVVNDPSISLDKIGAMADEMGGFVVNANLYTSQTESGQEVPRGAITIRVPAERLNEALERIQAESDREPLSKNIDSQDVTRDYTDLQSRLKNLESAEAQLTEIMGSATKTEDVLSVYNRLVEVREQIEVIKGQIQYYEQSAALSAISVDLLANAAVQPLTVGGWQPVGVAKDAVQGLIDVGKFLANALIWIVILVVPVLIVLYFVFFLPTRYMWRKIRKPRAEKITQIPGDSIPPAAE